jgi:hypothetical protein
MNQNPNPVQVNLIQNRLSLESQFKSGVNWFFWIAGLSLVNSLIYLFGGSLNFVVGLGATQLIDGFVTALAQDLGGGMVVRVLGFGLDVFVAGIFVVFGILARKKQRWAVFLGMMVYLLDGFIYLAVGEFLAVIFHAWALYGLWRGQQAMQALETLEAASVPGETGATFAPD